MRFLYGFAFVVFAALVTALGVQHLHGDPETAPHRHLERPTAGVSGNPASVGADSPVPVIEGLWAGVVFEEGMRHEAMAQEAARVARARSTSGQRVAGSGSGAVVATGNVWDDLAQCESSGNWDANTGNGFYGGLQIQHPNAVGMTREEQIAWAEQILARQGWGAWPACSRKLGLR